MPGVLTVPIAIVGKDMQSPVIRIPHDGHETVRTNDAKQKFGHSVELGIIVIREPLVLDFSQACSTHEQFEDQAVVWDR